MRRGLCLRVIDGSEAVLFDAFVQMTLASVARLRANNIPSTVSESDNDEIGTPQKAPIDLFKNSPLSVDGTIRIAASTGPRPDSIRCNCQNLAPLNHEGHVEFCIVRLCDMVEADHCLNLVLGQFWHLYWIA